MTEQQGVARVGTHDTNGSDAVRRPVPGPAWSKLTDAGDQEYFYNSIAGFNHVWGETNVVS